MLIKIGREENRKGENMMASYMRKVGQVKRMSVIKLSESVGLE